MDNVLSDMAKDAGFRVENVIFQVMHTFQVHMDKKGIKKSDIVQNTGMCLTQVLSYLGPKSSPSNITVKTLSRLAESLGLDLTIVTYPKKEGSLSVYPEVFFELWEACGRPVIVEELEIILKKIKEAKISESLEAARLEWKTEFERGKEAFEKEMKDKAQAE